MHLPVLNPSVTIDNFRKSPNSLAESTRPSITWPLFTFLSSSVYSVMSCFSLALLKYFQLFSEPCTLMCLILYRFLLQRTPPSTFPTLPALNYIYDVTSSRMLSLSISWLRCLYSAFSWDRFLYYNFWWSFYLLSFTVIISAPQGKSQGGFISESPYLTSTSYRMVCS